MKLLLALSFGFLNLGRTGYYIALLLLYIYCAMDSRSTRSWRVLCWNVRGLNSDHRQRAVRNKIDESLAAVVCL